MNDTFKNTVELLAKQIVFIQYSSLSSNQLLEAQYRIMCVNDLGVVAVPVQDESGLLPRSRMFSQFFPWNCIREITMSSREFEDMVFVSGDLEILVSGCVILCTNDPMFDGFHVVMDRYHIYMIPKYYTLKEIIKKSA